MHHRSLWRIHVLAIAYSSAVALLLPGAALAESVQITASRLAVRKGPGTTHAKVGTAVQGVVYELLERKGPWVKIKFGEEGGWIHGKYTSKARGKTPAEDPAADKAGEGTHSVVPAKLNVRSAPGTQARIAFHLPRGTKVTVTETKGEWSKITHRSRSGWVMAKYLTTGSLPPPRRVAPRRPADQPARRPAAQPARRPAAQPARRPAAQPARRPAPQPAGRPAMRPSADE